MDRIIEIKVNGSYVTKDCQNAGTQGEANVTALRIEFDEGWDGYAKTITWWDANGENPTSRVLTADLLEDMAASTRIYLTLVPAEPLAVWGKCMFSIDGYINGKRQRSAYAQLVVKPKGNGEDVMIEEPTPSQIEQLQVQIDTLLQDMSQEADRAETAKENAEIARQAAEAAQQAAETARDEAQTAQLGAEAARSAAETAESNAELAQEAAENSAGIASMAAQNAGLSMAQAAGYRDEAEDAAAASAAAAQNAADTAATVDQKVSEAKDEIKAEVQGQVDAAKGEVMNSATEILNETKEEAEAAAESAEEAQQAAETARDEAKAAAISAGDIFGVFEQNVIAINEIYKFLTGQNTADCKAIEDKVVLCFYNGAGEEITDHASVFAALNRKKYIPFTTKSNNDALDLPRYDLALEKFAINEDGTPSSIEVSGYNKTDGLSIHIVYTYDYDNLDENGNPTRHSVMTLTKDFRGDYASAVVGEASGETVEIANSAALPLVGLTVYGKTTQDGTPTMGTPVELVSVADGGSLTVTENDQSISVSTPNGLPGIPVTSGGNYTDENGQQWVCDEVDFARGVYVQRIARDTLNGSENWVKTNATAVDEYALRDRYTLSGSGSNLKVMCDQLYAEWSHTVGVCYFYGSFFTCCPYAAGESTVDDWKAHLAENPLNIIYALGDPVETVLTEEEIGAYAALIAGYPATTITNDVGAWMEVSYVVDTKMYVDGLPGTVRYDSAQELTKEQQVQARTNIGADLKASILAKTIYYSGIELEAGYYAKNGNVTGTSGVHKHFSLSLFGITSVTITPLMAGASSSLYYASVVDEDGGLTNYAPISNTEKTVIEFDGNSKGTLQLNAFADDSTYSYVKEVTIEYLAGTQQDTVSHVISDHCVNKPYAFSGKTAFFFGDSITFGQTSDGQAEYPYCRAFSEKVGLTYTNYGKNGSLLAGTYGSLSRIPDIIKSKSLTSDFLFVAGGVNDWQVAIGLTEFRNGVADLCAYLKENYTGEVIFITPIDQGGWKTIETPVADLQEYRNIITELALLNGFSVVQGNRFNFPTKDCNADYIGALFCDKLHPSELGHQIYAKHLATVLC